MRLQACPARLIDDVATLCQLQITQPLPLCAHHYREYCTLKERERAAEREGDALKEVVGVMVAGGTDVYTTLREVETARDVAELYGRALERQAEGANALRVRFALGADDATARSDELEGRRKRATVLIGKLADRARVLATEEKARRAAANLRSILSVPHKPFSCSDGSADTVSASPAECRCPTIKLTSKRCTLAPTAGQRLCMLHVVTHTSISVFLRTLWSAMEASRMEVARIEVGRGSLYSNADAVRDYICKVDDAIQAGQKHQATYSCRTPAEHDAFVEELRKRMIAAMLVLGELEGGQEFQIALRQGHAEVWACEHLGKVIRLGEKELAGDVATVAIVGAGMSAVFGGPVGIGAFVGGAALLVRQAAGRDNSV